TISSLSKKVVELEEVFALESSMIELEDLVGTPADPGLPDQDTLFEIAEKILAEMQGGGGGGRAALANVSGLSHLLWLEAGLLENREGPLLSLPSADGGAIEVVQKLVHDTIAAQLELGIAPVRTAAAADWAGRADRALEHGDHQAAYRAYRTAYQTLVPLTWTAREVGGGAPEAAPGNQASASSTDAGL
ncbi:MAG: hypothetical protein V3T72_03725, partial [Thermoanaerobaculia bacterium]